MTPNFDMVVAAWATGRGLSITDAKVRLMGTPGWVEARLRHAEGGTERVVRMLLDAGYDDKSMER